ncbi:MAG: 1-deoxy-D-xylulose-5-phosphate synthase, partial [Collinsella intestinalis]|nr:1-deoxy-D-xylulose-5-phosphate synthase [Collinsella intestinalis]
MLLERISSPQDVKDLDAADLPLLCSEIRQAILSSSASVGGHIGSNLGVVELTVALHRVFDSPTDKLIFDVSHQTYAHKMLTGRAANYLDAERFGGLSGFTSPTESEHDLFSVGHTSTSVSLACGMAKARDLMGADYNVVAVIGDGSISGGLAFEGFDNLAELGTGVI